MQALTPHDSEPASRVRGQLLLNMLPSPAPPFQRIARDETKLHDSQTSSLRKKFDAAPPQLRNRKARVALPYSHGRVTIAGSRVGMTLNRSTPFSSGPPIELPMQRRCSPKATCDKPKGQGRAAR